MPGLAGRISTLTKAKISHMLDHAEDPAETLDYAYERQLEDLQNVNKGIAGDGEEAAAGAEPAPAG